ncbi:putative cell division protein FtsL [Clostridiales bacterium oral taxon 876 str. F0540]|nr:putative cell division protein FtsL [Clostridiales bacterium oral taxon 876 str. F0540]
MKKKFGIKKILIVLFSVYVCYIIGSTQVSMIKIRKELNTRQQELTKLQEKNQKLQDEVKMSQTDDYIEKLARERLGMIKDGETPVSEKK